MADLRRCYRHSGLVMYLSTLPLPSASAPCISAILTSRFEGRVDNGDLRRCYRHSDSVMYFSTDPSPSAAAPCISAILTSRF